MTKAQFMEAIQAKLRKALISEEAGEVDVHLVVDVHTQALAEVVYELLIEEKSDGEAAKD